MREEMKKQKTVEQEIREAQYAGQRALASLHMAEEKLGSARNWGIWDMLGGGFFYRYDETLQNIRGFLLH